MTVSAFTGHGTSSLRSWWPLALSLAVAAALGACGGDDAAGGAERELPPAAAEGRRIAEDNGCTACHRDDGDGVAPTWAALYGSTVTLADGTTVTADEAYLRRSITDPGAERVEGYSVAMPENDLDDDEVAAVVAYISQLGEGTPG